MYYRGETVYFKAKLFINATSVTTSYPPRPVPRTPVTTSTPKKTLLKQKNDQKGLAGLVGLVCLVCLVWFVWFVWLG